MQTLDLELLRTFVALADQVLMESLRKGEIDMTISTRESQEFEGVVLRTSPSHWICAAQFVLVAQQPLPLILIDEPSIFRRIALEALERHKIPWRQAYGASGLMGAKAPTCGRCSTSNAGFARLRHELPDRQSRGLRRRPLVRAVRRRCVERDVPVRRGHGRCHGAGLFPRWQSVRCWSCSAAHSSRPRCSEPAGRLSRTHERP